MPISMVPAFQCKNDMHVTNFSQCQAKLLQDFVKFNMNTSFAVSFCQHQHPVIIVNIFIYLIYCLSMLARFLAVVIYVSSCVLSLNL